ncbi:TPA: fimbrial protein [Enterobacter hormaechei subsp. steigerwaltii]|nr:fimbrial protein [Enterobacter hormaechei subsp. steigerwaltii]
MILQAVVLFCPPAQAKTGESPVRFHGTLTVVDCTVNDDQDQTVDFGDAVGVHRIDGKRYSQPVPFSMNCTAPDKGSIPPITMTLSGIVTDFDKAAVTTTVDKLGIEVQLDGIPHELNKPFTVNYAHLPKLTAVPVLKPGAELKAQPFKGGVRLIVEVV